MDLPQKPENRATEIDDQANASAGKTDNPCSITRTYKGEGEKQLLGPPCV